MNYAIFSQTKHELYYNFIKQLELCYNSMKTNMNYAIISLQKTDNMRQFLKNKLEILLEFIKKT